MTTVSNELKPQLVQSVIQAWSEVLELQPVQIGTQANFFALGGDSMSMIKVAAMLEDQFHIQIPFDELYDLENMDKWADYLETLLLVEQMTH